MKHLKTIAIIVLALSLVLGLASTDMSNVSKGVWERFTAFFASEGNRWQAQFDANRVEPVPSTPVPGSQ